jgi:hypothetical protein
MTHRVNDPASNRIWVRYTDKELRALVPGTPVVINVDDIKFYEETFLGPIFTRERHKYCPTGESRGLGWYTSRFGYWHTPERSEIHDLVAYDS